MWYRCISKPLRKTAQTLRDLAIFQLSFIPRRRTRTLRHPTFPSSLPWQWRWCLYWSFVRFSCTIALCVAAMKSWSMRRSARTKYCRHSSLRMSSRVCLRHRSPLPKPPKLRLPSVLRLFLRQRVAFAFFWTRGTLRMGSKTPLRTMTLVTKESQSPICTCCSIVLDFAFRVECASHSLSSCGTN